MIFVSTWFLSKLTGMVQALPNDQHESGNSRYKIALRALLTPYLLGTVLLVMIPALISLALAFMNYDGTTQPSFAGLYNFSFIFTYQAFLYGARNTIGFIILAVPLRLLAMLGLALLMDRPRRGIRVYRVAVYLPTLIPDIAYALMWTWIFNPLFGPVNVILNALGLPTPTWILDYNTVFWVVLVMSMFQIGEGFVVLLAGLRDIPEDYYQTAQIDGATRWQMFRYITLPLLRPWLVVLTFRDIVVGAQNVFTPAFIMMGGRRNYSGWFLPQMIYEEAFGRTRYGIASAAMVVWMVIAGLLILVVYRFMRGWGYAEEL